MKLSRFEMAAVKRTAKNVSSLRRELSKINNKIEELMALKNAKESEIDLWEAPIIAKHGYSSEQILSGEADEIAAQTENMPSVDVGKMLDDGYTDNTHCDECSDSSEVTTAEDPFNEPEL